MTTLQPAPVVIVEERGALGVVTLNRPGAINALTHEMVSLLSAALTRWSTDDTVRAIAITGSGERGLCAGGDVLSLRESVTQADGSAAQTFWRDEYRLNLTIATYPKPVLAVQDGIVLGGGIGVSGHASHRVVTERSRLGFPEVGIGFVPDVGATWLLSRANRAIGNRAALTGAHLPPGEAIAAGLADFLVPSENIPQMLAAAESGDIDAAVAAHAAPLPCSEWLESPATDDFMAESFAEVIHRLSARRTEEADAVMSELVAKSPLAQAVTWEALRRAESLPTLAEALETEFRVSTNMAVRADFAEGVRAQLVDRDRQPRWSHERVEHVSEAEIGAIFAAGWAGDLVLTAEKEYEA